MKVPNEEKLVIEHVDLLSALQSLEGRWATPDPAAMLLRDEEITAAGLARRARRASFNVRPSEIAAALRELLAEPRTYSIRWRD